MPEAVQEAPVLEVVEDASVLATSEDTVVPEAVQEAPVLEVVEDASVLATSEDTVVAGGSSGSPCSGGGWRCSCDGDVRGHCCARQFRKPLFWRWLEMLCDGDVRGHCCAGGSQEAPVLEVVGDAPVMEMVEDTPVSEVVEDVALAGKNMEERVVPPVQSMALVEMLSAQPGPDVSDSGIAEADFVDETGVETTGDGLMAAVPPPPDLDMDRSFRVSLLKDETQTVVSQRRNCGDGFSFGFRDVRRR